MSTNLWTSSLQRLLSHLGTGGASWTLTRSGVSQGSVTGYAVEELPSSLALALAGERAAAPTWYWLAAASVDVRVGDVLTSVSESTRSFTVRTSDTLAGVRLCRMEPKR